MPCTCHREKFSRRYPGSWLRPSSPAAPRHFCLPLLSSEPDGVHRRLSRRTQPSTLLSRGRLYKIFPPARIQPHCSGLWVTGHR